MQVPPKRDRRALPRALGTQKGVVSEKNSGKGDMCQTGLRRPNQGTHKGTHKGCPYGERAVQAKASRPEE